MPRKFTQYDRRRLARRNSIWDDAEPHIYNRKEESGFITIPRTLPLVCTLLKILGEKNDPSRVYFELWCRQRDDGFVEIDDGDEVAAAAGFYRGSTRRVRSLREALDQLEKLGFIRISGKGPRKYAFILILHPHDVVQRIKHEHPDWIPDWWWSLFSLRVQDIGAKLRWEPPKAAPATLDAFPEALDDEDDDLPF